MKTLAPTLVVLALVGGGAAGAGAALLLRSPGPEPPVAVPIERTAGADVGLAARVDALAAENRALRERLAILEGRPAPAARLPADLVRRDELDALRAELAQLAVGRIDSSAEAAPFRDRVADALTAIRKEERVRQVRGDQEKRKTRLDDDVTRLVERLELTPYQSDRMRTALLAQYDREDEVRRLWEDGADDALLAERKTTAREQFEGDLEHFLSAEQVDAFWTTVRRGK